MIFNSLEYVALLAIVFIAYWLVSRSYQNILLLVASYVFYAFAHPMLVVLLVSYTLVHFFCGLGIKKFPGWSKCILIGAISFSLITLGIFKYFDFFVGNINYVLGFVGLSSLTPAIYIILPVGISFYTFQTLGYTIDVFRGQIEPRSNFINFALFASFFPQLVAGPIERARDLLPQIEKKRLFNSGDIQDGLILMMWGFFKKMVIADNVAIIVNKIFLVDEPGFALIWIGVFAFAIQILADFSGYTDIARGTAKILGIRLSENFRHPYLTRSPAEFWRRWHITLSFWFRDYVYIPLGGSRGGTLSKVLVLLVTFFLTGLWHGAGWNFILWGVYNGLLIQFQRMLTSLFPKVSLPKTISGAITFVLITVGWLFFRETDITYIVKYMTQSPALMRYSDLREEIFILVQVLIFSAPIWLHGLFDSTNGVMFYRNRRETWHRYLLKTGVAALLFILILAVGNDSSSEFLYFQF